MKTSVRGHRSAALTTLFRAFIGFTLPEILFVKRAKQHELNDNAALAGRIDEFSESFKVSRVPC